MIFVLFLIQIQKNENLYLFVDSHVGDFDDFL